jgi:hypothetical protein
MWDMLPKGMLRLQDGLGKTIREAMASALAAGQADLHLEDQGEGDGMVAFEVRPTRATACPVSAMVQQDDEIHLYVGPRDNPYRVTVSYWGDDVLLRTHSYVQAVFDGRVEVETKGKESARATFLLANGERKRHSYNVGWPFGRWETHTFDPY